MKNKQYKTLELTVYKTVDETTRLDYGGYVIQIYPYDTSTEPRRCHAIIGNENGCDVVVEKDCLLECILLIDNWNKKGIKK